MRHPSCRVVFFALLTCLLVVADQRGQEPKRQPPADYRLGKPKTLNDYFPMQVPESKQAWEKRRKELREQVLVANGLWPMPEKTPLNAVVHGKIDRDDYTVEKVFLASLPGHYVCGNLYRPKAKGKHPGILCPHGHWRDGRFFEEKEAGAKKQIDQGAEKNMAGAQYPLQARCAQLARMGCVVFHYDMVGYADSQAIKHRAGFTDAEAELRLQSFMGLQTWNSIRALDFLLSLPDVDPNRIGVTGASGGGTQTFLLGAVDDRPHVAFPAVMVSTAMQGGCICENCSYLRQFAGNIDLAALFAPKPLAMSGAKDWTIDIETKGLPELKEVYKLYGAGEKVYAKCFPQFGHNYNQVSREVMYNWFNKHLDLQQPMPVVERDFKPIPAKELSVFDDQHPLPKDAVDAERLRAYLTESSDQQIKALKPADKKSLAEFDRVVGTALRVMVNDRLPDSADEVQSRLATKGNPDQVRFQGLYLGRQPRGLDQKEQVPAYLLEPAKKNGTIVVWVHPQGKSTVLNERGEVTPEAAKVLATGASILAPDVFMTGEFGDKAPEVNKGYAGYTFGYNRPLLANRVHDILTAVGYAQHHAKAKKIELVGFGKAGPWVVLARGLCGDAVQKTAADLDQFRFEKVKTTDDEMMLPGALKYGGLYAFAALAAPGELLLYNTAETGSLEVLKSAYASAGASGKLEVSEKKLPADKVLEWLVK
ncbi:MAG: alpha/beta hydrolase family protein [Gemmataceae bacterium]